MMDCFQVYGELDGKFVLVTASWTDLQSATASAVLGSIQIAE